MSIDNVTVVEAAGAEAAFTVTLSGTSSRAVTVDYATSNGTAGAGSDYTTTTGALSIPAGSITGTISVPVIDDNLDEPDETFTITLSAPSNATIDDEQGTGTITDDEATPTVSIGDVTVAEGAGAIAVFPVTLSRQSSRDVTVDYATSNDTATAGSDYTTTASTLTIEAGATAGSIRVPVLDDNVDEPDETFTVTLSAPSNATIDDEQGTGTITDDEATPTLSIGDATVAEGPGAVAVFTVTLSGRSSQTVTVDYATSNDTATAGSDYTATSDALTIPAGSITGTISVPVLDDDLDEPDETFTVTLTSPSNAMIDDGEGIGTITEDDLPPTLSIGDAAVTEGPGAEAVFTVTLSGTSSRVVTVDYETSDRTAEAGSDYTFTGGTLSFPAGSRNATISVPVLDDDVDEPEETFIVTLSDPSSATIADGEGEGAIADDEATPTMSIGDVTVAEAPGAEALFTVTLSGPSSLPVTVDYATSDRTALAGSDYMTTSAALSIPAGSRTGSIRVPILDDDIAEPDETFAVTLNTPSNATVADGEGIGTITDDEATPTLSIGDAAVAEGVGAVAVFTVTLSGPNSRPVTVNYETSNGTAEAGLDYTATSSSLTITAGSRNATIRVPVLNDNVDEPDETFTVTLSGPSDATIADGEGAGAIADDEATPTMSIGDATVTEAPGAEALFAVTLSGTSSRPVTVNYATSDGTAAADSDYTATGGTLRIPAGAISATIRVPVLDDSVDEPDETFTVTLTDPAHATVADGEGTGAIRDDNDTPSLSIGDATVVKEAGAEAIFPVTLSAESSRDVTATYQTSDGTATAGSDYTATTGTLTIPAGSRAATIRAPILDDDVNEPDETFTVTLSNPSNAVIANERGTGTITEDDLPPTLSIGDATVHEEAGAEAVFTVTLSGSSSRVVTVRYRTSDGSADAGSDYTAATGALSISAGDATGTIRAPVLDDALDEPDETFTVILSSPMHATVADGEGIGTITDDDEPPTLSISDATVAEASGARATFTVTLSEPSGLDVNVNYETSDGTAEAGSDYQPSSGALTIPAGSVSGVITVPVLDDQTEEPDETFMATLSNPANATVADGEGIGTITDQEQSTPGPGPSVPTLSIGDAAVTEGKDTAAEFTVTLSASSPTAVTVDYETSDGSAAAGSDYTATSGALTIPAGETTGVIQVPVLDDTEDEPDETFTVTLTNPGGATVLDGDGAGTIADDDGGLPTLSIDDATVPEGPGAVAEFTVTLSAPSPVPVTVDYASSDGTATAGTDYTATSGTLTIPAGDTSGTIRVPVLDDTEDEPDETFTVTLSNPEGATILDGEGAGTIADNDEDDDDDPPTVSVGDATVTEGPDATAEFTVTLSAPGAQAVMVDYTTSDGTARAGSDYTAAAGTLIIPAGVASVTIWVSVVDDHLDEPDETFTVTLSNPVGVTVLDGDGAGTILDNEKPPTISIGDTVVTEGDGTTPGFPVSISSESSFTVTVTYTTSDRDAEGGSDYFVTRGALSIPAGDTSGTILVVVIDDELDEPDERFAVILSNPRHGKLDDDEGIGTIIDDDEPPVTVSYEASSYALREGQRVEVAVVLSAPPQRQVVVPLTEAPGRGATDADYYGVPSSVAFGPSQTRRSFTVVAVTDAEYEDAEQVELGFGPLPKSVTAADPEIATVTIDDDYVPEEERDAWLDKFGRVAAGHVMEALDDRMRCAPDRRPDEPAADRDAAAADQNDPATVDDPAGDDDRPPRWRCRPPYRDTTSATVNGYGPDGALRGAAPGNSLSDTAVGGAGRPGRAWGDTGAVGPPGRTGSYSLLSNDLLTGSSFHAQSEPDDDGYRYSLWGRGSYTRFDSLDGDVTLSGDVRTATLGTDYSGDRWMAGVALSHSRGDGMVTRGLYEADVRSDLTGLYPYLRYGVNERLSVWAMAGYGTGTLRLESEGRPAREYKISMMMGAAGARSELLSPRERNDFALTLKADALFVRTFSEKAPGPGTAESDATRMRLALEGSYEYVTEDDEWLSPFIEAGLRHDGGDAETGWGIEVGGGFRYGHPVLNLMAEFEARGLLAHEADGFSEWGVSASLRYDQQPSSENGASVTVSPAWGAAGANGAQALWQRQTMAGLATSPNAADSGRLDTELAYGLPVFRGSGTGSPIAGISLSEVATDYRAGYRLAFGHKINLSFEAALRKSAQGNTPSDYGVLVRGAMRW